MSLGAGGGGVLSSACLAFSTWHSRGSAQSQQLTLQCPPGAPRAAPLLSAYRVPRELWGASHRLPRDRLAAWSEGGHLSLTQPLLLQPPVLLSIPQIRE